MESMAAGEGAEGPAVSAASPLDPPEQRLATAGYPLGGIELRVVEAGDGIEAGAGEEIGRLGCRQPNGTGGYLIQEERWLFAPRTDDEWFETGDLARLRADGYVEILGRSGLSVKRDGLLVVFADVETAVEKVEEVRRAVVVSVGESRRGARLVAVCLLDPERTNLIPDAMRRRYFDLL